MLTYNLVRTQSGGPNSAQVVIDEKEGLQSILQAWNYKSAADQINLREVIYFLEHQYSQANLSFDLLKGHDAILGRVVTAVCEEEDMTPLLATMSSKDMYNQDNEDEEHEYEYKLENLTLLDSKIILHSASMKLDELIQEGHLDRMPDKNNEEETGNEGTEITNFYRDTVSTSTLWW